MIIMNDKMEYTNSYNERLIKLSFHMLYNLPENIQEYILSQTSNKEFKYFTNYEIDMFYSICSYYYSLYTITI